MKNHEQLPPANPASPDRDEPMGIVISSGQRREPEPRFAAYVWGPVPGVESTDEVVAVA